MIEKTKPKTDAEFKFSCMCCNIWICCWICLFNNSINIYITNVHNDTNITPYLDLQIMQNILQIKKIVQNEIKLPYLTWLNSFAIDHYLSTLWVQSSVTCTVFSFANAFTEFSIIHQRFVCGGNQSCVGSWRRSESDWYIVNNSPSPCTMLFIWPNLNLLSQTCITPGLIEIRGFLIF